MASVPRPRRDEFEIAIFSVLKAERDAIEAALDEEYECDGFAYSRAPSDINTYTVGRLGYHHVVLVYLPHMGSIGSAPAAASIKATFPGIKLALVVGVCGVSPYLKDECGREVILGDVLISTGVVKINSGQQYPDRLALRTEVEHTLGRAPTVVRGFLDKLQGVRAHGRLKAKATRYANAIMKGLGGRGAYPGADQDKLFSSKYRHKHQDPNKCSICARCTEPLHGVCDDALISSCASLGCDDERLIRRRRLEDAKRPQIAGFSSGGATITEDPLQPCIWFGQFACSEFVLSSEIYRDQLARDDFVVAFETEGAGIWEHLPTIIIKGAWNYADSHNDRSWQQYAAITAAACTKAVVEEWRTSQPHLDPATQTCRNCGRSTDNTDDFNRVSHESIHHLRDLPHDLDAAFCSTSLENTPPRLENSRIALLRDVRQWDTNNDSQPVFWLQRVAGASKTKTTIPKT
ncbi:nucleoside phosphorylase domain-containing protein [Aspergillus spinulosporus]